MLAVTSLFWLTAVFCNVASATSVFAHFMVQNAYAYTVAQWKTDMASALDIGIDGFALNWIPPDCQSPSVGWETRAIDDAYHAAEQMGFSLMYSFDMSYPVCNTFWNQTFMEQMITKYASNPATYRWKNDILVSTYGGDAVKEYGNSFFQGLKDSLASSGNTISLAPALTTYSTAAQTFAPAEAQKMISDFPSVDGYLNWQAWPLNSGQNMSVTPDKAFQSALKSAGKKGPYIMAVSAWQFKDLDDGNPMNSWVAYSDTLIDHRFKSLISNDIQPDIIELLTWNDYGESQYLRDLPKTDVTATDHVELGNMANYVLGMNHAPWRIIAGYYIQWWKTGSPPCIDLDQVIYWYRTHPKTAVCSGGTSVPIRGALYPEDAVFVWALVTSPANISVSVGSNEFWTFQANGTGPSMSMVPFPSDLSTTTPSVAIVRNGKTIQVSKGTQPISRTCAYQNFNAVVNLAGPGVNTGLNDEAPFAQKREVEQTEQMHHRRHLDSHKNLHRASF